MPRATKEASEETARRILEVAILHFHQRGFGGTDLMTVAAEAGVTRGAIYHHYPNKRALFSAVVAGLHVRVQQQIETATELLSDPWDQLLTGCEAFISAAIDPAISKILLIEAPSVLGWDTWRELDEATSFSTLTEVLGQLESTGQIHPGSTEASARLLSGAMNEVSLWIARDPDPITAKSRAVQSLSVMIRSLQLTP